MLWRRGIELLGTKIERVRGRMVDLISGRARASGFVGVHDFRSNRLLDMEEVMRVALTLMSRPRDISREHTSKFRHYGLLLGEYGRAGRGHQVRVRSRVSNKTLKERALNKLLIESTDHAKIERIDGSGSNW